MSTGPKVSVITSSYNCDAYLSDCVASVLGQSYDSWEHIIIDCGSLDKSRQTLDSLTHQRLRVLHEEFCGVGRARNIAIQHASGEFCAILDADDLALPDRLFSQVELLQHRPEVVAVGGGIQGLYYWNQSWERTFRSKKMTIQYPYHDDGIKQFLSMALTPIPHSTLTFRKTAFQNIGGYREAMEKAEDFDLVLRLSLNGSMAGVREPVSVIRVGSASSHTARHRPLGRDHQYYAVLSLLFNTAGSCGVRCTQPEIEEWLDEIGKQGVSGLQGRWVYENIMAQRVGNLFAGQAAIPKAVLRFLPAIIACRNTPWWHAASSPQQLLKDYLFSGNRE